MLDANDGDTAALKRSTSLKYANYTGKKTEKGRPIGHFRLLDSRHAYRVSCEALDGELLLRRFGPHDPVNENP
jgi:hypothetical protein